MSDSNMAAKFKAAAEYILGKIETVPQTALVLGSGLSTLAGELTDAVKISYGEIPGFPASTAPAHEGALYCGKLAGKIIFVLSGRFHCYEGYSMKEAAFYTGVLALLGVKNLILTNAAGAVNMTFDIGDIMLISDHIKLAAESPLTGAHNDIFGSRFADMTEVYNRDLADAADRAALSAGVVLQRGVYMYFAGPQYETPAEIKAAAVLGADAVGMSTVPEAIAAHAAGIRVAGLSVITNMAAGLAKSHPSEKTVIDNAALAGRRMSTVIKGMLALI